MKKSYFRGFHIDDKGGFSTLITPEGQNSIKNKKQPKKEDVLNIKNSFKEKETNVSISVKSVGDKVISRKTASDSEPAETMVAIVRSLVGMVETVSGLYRLDSMELMDKVQRLIEEEFNEMLNNHE